MSNTSSAVKDRYNRSHYLKITVSLKKELVEEFRKKAKENGDPIAEIIRKTAEEYISNK